MKIFNKLFRYKKGHNALFQIELVNTTFYKHHYVHQPLRGLMDHLDF